jgi:hypothetical protein
LEYVVRDHTHADALHIWERTGQDSTAWHSTAHDIYISSTLGFWKMSYAMTRMPMPYRHIERVG